MEWYEVYDDGHQEGFQAKFHDTLADALGGMRESVKAVCGKRPALTKLTFVVPYDFTDSGEAETKSDQDRWTDAVAGWKRDVAGASQVEFSTVRAGDIVAKLTQAEHAGRREYWFGGLEITDDWLRSRFAESVGVAGHRYTPEADSAASVNSILDALVCGPELVEGLRSAIERASTASRHDTGMWGADPREAAALIDRLDIIGAAAFGETIDGAEVVPTGVPDVAGMAEVADALLDLAYARWDTLPTYDRGNLDDAISALQALADLASGSAARALTDRAIELVGPAGQGKTHALMRSVDRSLERGVPAVAILGQRLSDRPWWPAVTDSLGGLRADSDEFLQALDSIAEARGCRALIVIDAINESQAPHRWQTELPAILAQFRRYPHVALVVSYRSDYRDVVGAPTSILTVRHGGVSGYEDEALSAYCKLFDIPVPTRALFETAFASPLFLRMYCEILASEPHASPEGLTRSNLFERYADVTGRKVTRKLRLSPTSSTVADALTRVADLILRNDGQPISRGDAETEVDGLLPGRSWPDTLFQQLASEGLIELRPSFGQMEAVAFPFQAYSEHLVARRLLASVDEAPKRRWARWGSWLVRPMAKSRRLARALMAAPWSWRSMAVILPEREGVELLDLLPASDDSRLQDAMRESLTDRASTAFGDRALKLLHEQLTAAGDDGRGIETVLALAPRERHAGNADWLHARLVGLTMADRDSTWSIATFQADRDSPAFRRLIAWVERHSAGASREEMRLASIVLMWLLTSPNRFLRDVASKTLVTLFSVDLEVAAHLVATAQAIDEPYVQERVLTCVYGAVLVGGDADLDAARGVGMALSVWARAGLPIDVLARDSARGIAAWCVDRGLLDVEAVSAFDPPYGASSPTEPPTREQLEADHGAIKDADGTFTAWRASAILGSCLDWTGDFNHYVVQSDVNFFSWHPLDGPAPTGDGPVSTSDKVDAKWAGRWIAHRAIALGWTAERFAAFEDQHDLRQGRDAHKAERFGKKYQWIAHRELLARLADNMYPAYDRWGVGQPVYEGPWVWYGRDLDPTLPPSRRRGGSLVCEVDQDPTAGWAVLDGPSLYDAGPPAEWVARTDDLPAAATMFQCTDPDSRSWTAIQRYSTWDRDDARRAGMTKRVRDVFFLQFSWLVPRGRGVDLYDFIERRGLSGRWMPDTRRSSHHYLGETASAPIVATAIPDPYLDEPLSELAELNLRPRPAVEQFMWEGNTLDCSIDESVDFYVPTAELLGAARWVGRRSEWSVDGEVVAKAVRHPNGRHGQDVLLVDTDWLAARLQELDADMVIGTLSERHARPVDGDADPEMEWSDVWYVALVTTEGMTSRAGPHLAVR